ncbi:MAG: hypothetical protein ACT4OJ_04320 [Bacteroidota bacterium]
MNAFKDLGVKMAPQGFTGNKIDMDDLLNKEIVLLDYKITDSKYQGKGSGKCLHLWVQVEGKKRVAFNGATGLMNTLDQIDKSKFPFTTVIKRENKRYEFT